MLIILSIYTAVISIPAAFTEPDNIPEYVPCDRGWYYWGEKCYVVKARKEAERLPWHRALEQCKNYGGDLVSIESKEEQDFVLTFVQLDVKAWVWIGLNDNDREGDWKWTDGTTFNYTNWKPGGGGPYGVPPRAENCVHMWFEPENDLTGTWNDRDCGMTEAFICEKKPNPRKRSPNPMYCSSDTGRGIKWGHSCYHVVTEKKSWQKAERHCKNYYNGHLVSIMDILEDKFLDYILANVKEEVWIGIKIKEQLQQKWSSGWYVSYDGFKKATLYREGTCSARRSRKNWITIPCAQELSYICKVSKETPPVLKSPPKGAQCPTEFDGWRDLGGEYCYYFETERALNFYEALFDCKRKGGSLASLHSKEENDLVLSFVKYNPLGRSFYIGLFRTSPREEVFAWTDGSKVDYVSWKVNSPNNEMEKCVEALNYLIDYMYTWNDVACVERRGYICSVKKRVPSSALAGDRCKNFCISPTSYLYDLIQQSPDVQEVPNRCEE